MTVPSREAASAMLKELKDAHNHEQQHAHNVAKAAEKIASHIETMNAGTAYVLGLLHDVGRAFTTGKRHEIEGYYYLMAAGYPDAARITLTHGCSHGYIKEKHKSKYSEEEILLITNILFSGFTDYDKLIQLCDCLGLLTGICPLETRFVDIALRNGVTLVNRSLAADV